MRRSAHCRHFSAVQRFGLTAAVCPPEAGILFSEGGGGAAEGGGGAGGGGGFCSLWDGATLELLRRGEGVFLKVDFLREPVFFFLSVVVRRFFSVIKI